ncbi:MAG: amino acid--[acyl-carrier-protein] ligase [Acidimicrobiales bacterium]
MTATATTPLRHALSESLSEAGLLRATTVEGLYVRSHAYEQVSARVHAMVGRLGSALGAIPLHLPAVMPRSTMVATGYLASFSDLVGSVHVFSGQDPEHAALVRSLQVDPMSAEHFSPGQVVLAPAACYGLYPLCTGVLPDDGALFEVSAQCFRHEPSGDPMRMQCFSMHEIVFLGEPEAAVSHRDAGLERGLELLGSLGLDVEAAPANDPFFGRLGTALASSQREEQLKFEGIAMVGDGPKVALMSANCHRDHFADPFEIRTSAGSTAHSACVGFGIDRIAVALFDRHGTDPKAWPRAVRARLFDLSR